MKYFNFDKFSRSSWFGSSHNRAWSKYEIPTHGDSAKDERGEHNFLTPSPSKPGVPYTERCICGWSGDCWADHLQEAVDGTPGYVDGRSEKASDQVVSDPAPVAPTKPSNKKDTAETQGEPVTEVADEAPGASNIEIIKPTS